MKEYDNDKEEIEPFIKYEETADLKERNTLIDDENEDITKVTKLIDETTTEPQLMEICKKDPDACNLLVECSKLASKKSWNDLKIFLENTDILNDKYNNEINGKNEINYKIYIKHFYLGITNFRLGDYQTALNNFKESFKLHRFYQLTYNIALCYIKLENYENAILYLDDVIKENKNFFYAYYNLIKIYLIKSNINDAFLIYRDFSDIIKKQKEKEKISMNAGLLTPKNSYLCNSLKIFYKIGAECLFAKQLFQECVYTILEGLNYDPNDSELWCLYAKVFIKKKNFKVAISLLRKVLEINKDYEEAKKLLIFLEKKC